jgi:hypothetical protein
MPKQKPPEPELAHDSPEYLRKLVEEIRERERTDGPIESWPSIYGDGKPLKAETKNPTKSLFGD